jgi:hypothetical protein
LNALQDWMDRAKPAEKKQLAALAGTTMGALRQAAGAWRTNGILRLTPEFAQKVEAATRVIHISHPELPVVTQGQLCPACNACMYFQNSNR